MRLLSARQSVGPRDPDYGSVGPRPRILMGRRGVVSFARRRLDLYALVMEAGLDPKPSSKVSRGERASRPSTAREARPLLCGCRFALCVLWPRNRVNV